VGETWSATPEIAKLYSDPARHELSMVFQFEHITITHDPKEGKWTPRPFDLIEFKQVITKWQTALADTGWNSLFWNNHDLPRAVSKYGDPGRYRVESAKMLATALHLLKGTPYVYQGEEIGMTNVRFDSIDDYRDIESLNLYRERVAAGVSPAAMMEGIYANGRDNARTPMQWDASANAGFSSGEPWLKLNPNYREINAAAALADPGSIFHHYRRLIALRKERPAIVYGEYQPLFESHPQVFAYQRHLGDERIVVINNFGPQAVELELPPELGPLAGECLVSNYPTPEPTGRRLTLRPYESFAIALDAAAA
jgi:oligo-1,6-glucosidase